MGGIGDVEAQKLRGLVSLPVTRSLADAFRNFADDRTPVMGSVAERREAMSARTSSTRQATEFGPSRTGSGNRPHLIPAYHVARDTGMIGAMPRLRLPRIR